VEYFLEVVLSDSSSVKTVNILREVWYPIRGGIICGVIAGDEGYDLYFYFFGKTRNMLKH